MTATILAHDDVEVHGVLLEVEAECSAVYQDDSFGHAFGVERCGHWEIEEIGSPRPTENVRARVTQHLRAKGMPQNNRRFKKRVRFLTRKIEAALSALDPEEVFTELDQDRAMEECSNQAHEREFEVPYEDADRYAA